MKSRIFWIREFYFLTGTRASVCFKRFNSDYKTWLSTSDFDSFPISSIKTMAVEIHKILNGMGPEYLPTVFSKSNVPYQLRDGNNSTAEQTTAFGINSLAYFGTHRLEYVTSSYKKHGILREIKSMTGPTCHCCVCTLVVWYHSLLVFNYRFITHCPFNYSIYRLHLQYYVVAYSFQASLNF